MVCVWVYRWLTLSPPAWGQLPRKIAPAQHVGLGEMYRLSCQRSAVASSGRGSTKLSTVHDTGMDCWVVAEAGTIRSNRSRSTCGAMRKGVATSLFAAFASARPPDAFTLTIR